MTDNIRTVLIVEDDYMMKSLWEQALRRNGLTNLTFVYDGQQALEHLRDNPLPDIFITDFNLPYMDGGVLLAELEARDPDRKVYRVIVSAYQHLKDQADLMRRVDLFLTKPVGYRKLIDIGHKIASV